MKKNYRRGDIGRFLATRTKKFTETTNLMETKISEPTRGQILNFLDKKIERLQPEVDVYRDQKLRNQRSPRWLLRSGKKASEEHELLTAIRRLIESLDKKEKEIIDEY